MRYLKFLFVLLLTSLYYSTNAQVYGFKHVIGVGSYSEWGKGYLMVQNPGVATINGSWTYDLKLANNRKWVRDGDTLTSYDLIGTDRYPRIGDLIIEVDGVSAKGWDANKFYSVVDGRKDIVTLKLKTRKKGGVIQEYEIKICPKTKKLRGLEYSFKKLDYGEINKRVEFIRKGYELFETRYDHDFDFFNATRYAFAISGNSDDPLLDKELLTFLTTNIGRSLRGESVIETLGTMIYDEKNPDIIFTIARSAEQNIATTYVPPSYRTVNTGSTTKVTSDVYPGRYWGSIYSTSKTTQHGYTVKDGDYTVTTRTSDVYLQVVALDAKKINDPKQTYAPIIWEAVAKKHIVNGSETPTEVMKDMIFDFQKVFPILNLYTRVIGRISGPFGAIVDSKDPHRLKDVIPYSLADVAGFRPGDMLEVYHPDIEAFPERREFKYRTIVEKAAQRGGWYATFCPFYNIDDGHFNTFIFSKDKEKIKNEYRGEKFKHFDDIIWYLTGYGSFKVLHEDGSQEWIYLGKPAEPHVFLIVDCSF